MRSYGIDAHLSIDDVAISSGSYQIEAGGVGCSLYAELLEGLEISDLDVSGTSN